MTVASRSEKTRDQRFDRLFAVSIILYEFLIYSLLAETSIIVAVLALYEQYFHALRHINPQEHVWKADKGGEGRKQCCLKNGIFCQVLLPETLCTQIPLDHELTIKTAKDSKYDVKYDLEEMPIPIVSDLEHDKLASAEWIHGGEDCGGYHCTEVAPPHRLQWEVIRHFLHTLAL